MIQIIRTLSVIPRFFLFINQDFIIELLYFIPIIVFLFDNFTHNFLFLELFILVFLFHPFYF